MADMRRHDHGPTDVTVSAEHWLPVVESQLRAVATTPTVQEMPTFWKEPVRAVETTRNVSLSGTAVTVDGVSPLSVGDRILLLHQTDATQNGIYVVQPGSWLRAPDATLVTDLGAGAAVYTTNGTTWKGVAFRQTVPEPISFQAMRFAWTQPDYDVTAFGARGDGVTVTNCTYLGNAALDAPSGAFSNADIGKQILIRIPSDPLADVTTTAHHAEIEGAGFHLLQANNVIAIDAGGVLTDYVVVAVNSPTQMVVTPTPVTSGAGTLYLRMDRVLGTVSGVIGATGLEFLPQGPLPTVISNSATLQMGSDDSVPIQAALTAATAAGGGTVVVPPGTFVLGSKISIPSNVTVTGAGRAATVLRAGPVWVGVPGQGMVELRGAVGAQLRDLTLDQAAHGRDGDLTTHRFIDHTLVCAATQSCTIERVRFLNAGMAATTNITPSGPVLLFIAKDTPDDLGGQSGVVAYQACRDNVVRDCEFIQSGAVRISKGLSLFSDFGLLGKLSDEALVGGPPWDPAFDPTPQTTVAAEVKTGASALPVANTAGLYVGDEVRIIRRIAQHVTSELVRISDIDIGGGVLLIDRPVSHDYVSGNQVSRVSVRTIVGPGMVNPGDTMIPVQSTTGFEKNEVVRIESADGLTYDTGSIFDIPNLNTITLKAPNGISPITHVYSAGAKFGLAKGYTVFAGGHNVSSLRSRAVDPRGDSFVNHLEGNIIERCTFSGCFALYAIGIQGGGTRNNEIRRCRFDTLLALNAVLIDKGAYSNRVVGCTSTSQRRDGLLDTGAPPLNVHLSFPMAVFACRSHPAYYDSGNTFEDCHVLDATGFVGAGLYLYDAGFAVGEYAVRPTLRGCSVHGLKSDRGDPSMMGGIAPGGHGFLLGVGNVDSKLIDCSVKGTVNGIFMHQGGAPTVNGSGVLIEGCVVDCVQFGIAVQPSGGLVRGTTSITRNRIRQSASTYGVILVGPAVDAAQVHGNYVENTGVPSLTHHAFVFSAKRGSADGNYANNAGVAYQLASTTTGQWEFSNNQAERYSQALVTNDASVSAASLGGLTLARDYDVKVSGTGDYKHGDRVRALAAAAGQVGPESRWGLRPSVGPTPTVWVGNRDGSVGRVAFAVPCEVGDRIKEVRARIRDRFQGFVSMRVFQRGADGSNLQLGSRTSSGSGAVQVLELLGLTATIDSGGFCHVLLEIVDSDDSYQIFGVEITYDRT